MPDSKQPIVDFLTRVAHAFGIDTPIDVEDSPDGPRFNMTGEEAELLARHRGEPLKALHSRTADQSLVQLVLRGDVEAETALQHAKERAWVEEQLKRVAHPRAA